MNWQTFLINNLSHEKAFESLCNQLFENWCHEAYPDNISYFTVNSGAGGDGGVESYAILKDNTVVGLQAKWFPKVIEASHIKQIRGSIQTALKIRPNIKKYIVCVPRDLASLTGRNVDGGDYEEKRWLTLVAEIKKQYPELELVLWNDHALTKELEKPASVGILKYWFHNSEISYDKLVYAFEKSKESWLFTKYVPELNCCGKVYKTIIDFMGNISIKEHLYQAFSKINSLAKEIKKPANDLISVIKENNKKSKNLKKYILELIDNATSLVGITGTILKSLENDILDASCIQPINFNFEFSSTAETLRKDTFLSNRYWHTVALTKILNKLEGFDFYQLFSDYQQVASVNNIIFKGDPGTGKSHGVASAIEKILTDKYHAGIIIQARDIEKTKSWKDIVLSNLGLSSNWEEDELWQALLSMIDKPLATKIINCLDNYGILYCYCQHGNRFSGNKYFYFPGLRSYFDHASTIIVLENFTNPELINFEEYNNLSVNTLYGIAVVAIRKYGYLITQNETLRKIVDDSTLAEIQYWALINSSPDVAKNFKPAIIEKMGDNSTLLYITVNRIILPLARKINHPLGTSLLNDFLRSFDKPAQRDILWSETGYLRESYNKKWNRNITLETLEEYPLVDTDKYNALPIVYVWSLSALNNTLRAEYRKSLMKWAHSQPLEFIKLFYEFSNVNDPQILSELYSILLCVAYETNNKQFVKEAFNWISNNVLSSEHIDSNRSIAIRYYAIAIIYKAIELEICDKKDVVKLLPPYSVNNYKIKLDKDALSGTRMSGYSGISYDLSRYVLIDHIESDFNHYNQKNKHSIKEFLSKVCTIVEKLVCLKRNLVIFTLTKIFYLSDISKMINLSR